MDIDTTSFITPLRPKDRKEFAYFFCHLIDCYSPFEPQFLNVEALINEIFKKFHLKCPDPYSFGSSYLGYLETDLLFDQENKIYDIVESLASFFFRYHPNGELLREHELCQDKIYFFLISWFKRNSNYNCSSTRKN